MQRILLFPIVIVGRAILICRICCLGWSGVGWKGWGWLPIALTQIGGILGELNRRKVGQWISTLSTIIRLNIVTHSGRRGVSVVHTRRRVAVAWSQLGGPKMSTSWTSSITTTNMSSTVIVSSGCSASTAIKNRVWLGNPRVAFGRRRGRWREGELETAHFCVIYQLSSEIEVTSGHTSCFNKV